MKKIIQLSDLHIVPKGERVFGFDPLPRMQAVLDDIREKHSDADLCIITGDLTDKGDRTSYELLRSKLEDFPVQLCLMMGNHDRRQPFLDVFPATPVDNSDFIQSALDLGGHRVVVLDSLDEECPGSGHLCPQRLAWLDAMLAESPEVPTIVALHHPPFDIGIEYFEYMLLTNGDELNDVLNRHHQVVHLIFGHVHLSVSGIKHGRSFTAARGTAHPIQFRQRQLEAYYIDRLPSYEVILFEGKTVTVHHVQVFAGEQYVACEVAETDGSQGETEIYRLV